MAGLQALGRQMRRFQLSCALLSTAGQTETYGGGGRRLHMGHAQPILRTASENPVKRAREATSFLVVNQAVHPGSRGSLTLKFLSLGEERPAFHISS